MSETTLPEIPTNGQSDELYASPPVQRVARLLRRIAEGDAVTNMARTARELGINRTTLLRLLHALDHLLARERPERGMPDKAALDPRARVDRADPA